MQDKINQFFLKWNGIGCDFDGAFGFQCMDIFEQYNKDLIDGQPVYGNAIDVIDKYDKGLYDFIPNEPSNSPLLGDIILWTNGVGQYGHISICYTADANHFISFDQNFPVGSLCHFQSHNYANIAGWLHPKVIQNSGTTTPIIPVITDQTRIPQIDNIEVQAIKSSMQAKDQKIIDLQKQPTTTTVYISEKSRVPKAIRRIFGDKI